MSVGTSKSQPINNSSTVTFPVCRFAEFRKSIPFRLYRNEPTKGSYHTEKKNAAKPVHKTFCGQVLQNPYHTE